jgi:hypothetical protein
MEDPPPTVQIENSVDIEGVRGPFSGSNIPPTTCQPGLRLHWCVLHEPHHMNFCRRE